MPTDEVVKLSSTGRFLSVLLFFLPFSVAAQNSPFPINSYTTDAQSFPAVCADTDGNFVVVWESGLPEPGGQDGSYLGIFGRRFLRGGTARGGEFAVNTYTTDYQTFPTVGCGDDGRFVVTWSSFGQDGSGGGVFGQRYDTGGNAVGTEFQVNAYTPGMQDYPVVDVAADGDFVVVWTSDSQDGRGLGVFGQRFSNTGTRTGIEFRANSYTTGDQTYPAVSVGNSGNFVVVWSSNGQDGDGNGIYAQRFSPAALEIGDEFRVNSTTIGSQGYPAIAMDSGGRFIVAWTSVGQDGNDAGVFARRFASDGQPLGSEVQVNTYTTGAQVFPRVSTSVSGELVVAWTSYDQDASDAGIFAQRFASDGERLGTEFQVNAMSAGAQYAPAVANAPDEEFVVVWATHDGDPSGTDVSGRWYSDATPTPTLTATRVPTATHAVTPTSPPPTSTTTVAPTGTATNEPTADATSAPTATPIDTPTNTATLEPSPTPTEVDTPTMIPPSQTPLPPLTGDCDNNGIVSVNELVTGVNVALQRIDLSRCDALDRNHDGQGNIDELVSAVREALDS